MIISHRHRFIFLKTGKAAGTSIELFLSRFLGPDDIATPVSAEDEPKRAPLRPTNYLREPGPLGWKRWGARLPGPVGRWIGRPDRRFDYFNHIPARLVRQYVGHDVWSGYFKFAFERNPWDRQVSSWYWATRHQSEATRPDFKTFTAVEGRRVRGFPIYSIDGTVAVDKIGRYETLEADLADILARVGIDAPVDLPRSKGGLRPDGDYRRHYDDATRSLIGRHCAREIALMGYEF